MGHEARRRRARGARGGSVEPSEVHKFAADAAEWWDPDGKFRPLHRINALRVSYVRDTVCRRFHRDATSLTPLAGLSVLDVGCGGGLLAEPMARLGASVTGVDADVRGIEVARRHASLKGIVIDYRAGTAEELAAGAAQYDIVLAMEVVEHVADLSVFLGACGALVRSGGLLFVATLNRTAKAMLLAVIGAEYVLRWLPRGTHDWRKFVRPSELERELSAAGMRLSDVAGISYNPLTDRWSISSDVDVNYIAVGTPRG